MASRLLNVLKNIESGRQACINSIIGNGINIDNNLSLDEIISIIKYAHIHGRKIYLTEFCAWEYNNGGQNESMENQTSSMKEKVAFMDSYSGCAGYAWFMSHGQTSAIPFNSIYEAKGADGTLTSLG